MGFLRLLHTYMPLYFISFSQRPEHCFSFSALFFWSFCLHLLHHMHPVQSQSFFPLSLLGAFFPAPHFALQLSPYVGINLDPAYVVFAFLSMAEFVFHDDLQFHSFPWKYHFHYYFHLKTFHCTFSHIYLKSHLLLDS